ncbi:hypothetical protein [Natronobacterium texcoconense]|uniref:Uncharacterized protein n=1 Tax=Natronobacterium texcoconense TaxID=1095778 RepID=A0A1H1EIM6_NATTX|nr:hypothetical protein [Natronobacterium texcoconense]SDQ88602.1 hypothetical protein SAMN04489842_1597 [Natronobacterium texcoconense]
MTSIRDLLAESLAVGETVHCTLEERDGRLVADHPNEESPLDIVVIEGADRLEERPPDDPVAVEIVSRIVDGRVAARIVDADRRSESR